MSSGSITTTNATDLLFAPAASSNRVNQGATGYTTRSTTFGNRTQDRTSRSAGSYRATGVQNSKPGSCISSRSGRTQGSTDVTPPTAPPASQRPASRRRRSTSAGRRRPTMSESPATASSANGTPGRDAVDDVVPGHRADAGDDLHLQGERVDAAGNASPLSPSAIGTTQAPPVDTTPPTVSFTSPASGSTVSGTRRSAALRPTRSASPACSSCSTGRTSAPRTRRLPYSISWDTTTATNGPHVLAARARDAAGNTTTSTRSTVTVSNTAPPPGGPAASYAFDEGDRHDCGGASGHGLTGTLSEWRQVGTPASTGRR